MANYGLILCVLTMLLQNSVFCEGKIFNFVNNKCHKKEISKNETISDNHLQFDKSRKCKKACESYNALQQALFFTELDFQLKIIGGTNQSIAEDPHIVALGYYNKKDSNYKFGCGGSLISPTYVLTAAHCIINPEKYKLKFVRVGTIFVPETTKSLDFLHDIPVKTITTHPEFKRISKLHDIAVVELEKSIRFSYSVKPSCLYTKNNEPEEMEICGWGTIENGLRSAILQTSYINPVSKQQCQEAYLKKYLLTIEPTHVCAGNDTINTCKGDSGGPLQIKKNKVSYLVGVTAGGAKCGSKVPGIYTRVSSYLDWIEKIVWP